MLPYNICSLKCMSFSFVKSVYILDFGLNQHSRNGKGSGSVTLLWDGWLDAAVSITFLIYVVSISESSHFVCKCYVSRIVQMLQFNSKSLIMFVCGDGMAVCFE